MIAFSSSRSHADSCNKSYMPRPYVLLSMRIAFLHTSLWLLAVKSWNVTSVGVGVACKNKSLITPRVNNNIDYTRPAFLSPYLTLTRVIIIKGCAKPPVHPNTSSLQYCCVGNWLYKIDGHTRYPTSTRAFIFDDALPLASLHF